MKIRLAADLQPDSIVDGIGIRTVVWTQGCPHNCKGCHNPITHSFDGGFLVDIEDLKEEISNLKNQRGITFSGGDPMCQPKECAEIAEYAKELGLDIWCYTGYKFDEDIISNMFENWPQTKELMSYIDVLVDGKFEEDKKDLRLKFRGSSNQRIIDVQKSLKMHKVIPYDV